MNLTISRKREVGKSQMIFTAILIAMCAFAITVTPAFAASATVPPELTTILNQMLGYIGIIFRAVGILLAICAVGQMVLAFKDENPDAKSKSASILVVGILLVAMPSIIDALNLTSYLGS